MVRQLFFAKTETGFPCSGTNSKNHPVVLKIH